MQEYARLGFGLSSEMCELLVAFETAGLLAGLADLVGKDVSVVSRQLQRLSRVAPVLEKRQGRWRVSALGEEINAWTRDVAAAQRRILHQRTLLRLASTREFAARVLAPQLPELAVVSKRAQVSILTCEDGVEKVLLAGQADLGFDCGSPEDPGLRFKRVLEERFVVVAAPRLLAGKRLRQHTDLLALPHLQYERASAPRLLQLSYDVSNIVASFNDVATIREACCAGAGWAVLPLYAVRREVDQGALRVLPGWKIQPERFGVWWVTGRADVEPWVRHAVEWLEKQSLS